MSEFKNIRKHRDSWVNYAEIIQVIHVSSAWGEGTADDVIRTVHHYYSMDGKLIVKIDPFADSPEMNED